MKAKAFSMLEKNSRIIRYSKTYSYIQLNAQVDVDVGIKIMLQDAL